MEYNSCEICGMLFENKEMMICSWCIKKLTKNGESIERYKYLKTVKSIEPLLNAPPKPCNKHAVMLSLPTIEIICNPNYSEDSYGNCTFIHFEGNEA